MANDEETCFPRGRPKPADDKGVSKKERTRDHEEKDYLFGKKNDRKEKPSVKKANSDHTDEKPVVVTEEDDLPVTLKSKNVEYLSYKKIQPGALVLGVVRSTEEFELTVSLPFSMVGVVKAPNILTAYTAALTEELHSAGTIKSKSLNDIFYVGQLLVCKVMNVIPKKCFVQLTVDPKEVNANLTKSNLKKGMIINGCVTSEEDHGYVVDVGLSSTKAFLSKKNMDSEKDESFGQWSNVRCVILDVKSNGSIIQLSNDCRKVNKSMDVKDMNVDSLQPGCLVKYSLVKAVEGQGEIVKFGELQGSIALSSLSDKKETEEEEEEEEEEKTTQEGGPKAKKRKKKQQRKDIFSDKRRVACITYVSNEKLICLTDKGAVWNENKRFEHLQKLRVDYPKMKVLNKVKVTARIKGIGIMCELEKGISGVCLMRNLFDKQDQLNEEKYKIGNHVQARVLDNMTLDGAVDLGCKKSILVATVLSFEDLQAGDKVQAKILAVNPNGLQVLLGTKQDGEFRSNGSVRGFVPSLHLSDIVLKQPAKFFNESDIITCRVLSVDASQRQLRLTHKPTLVKLKQPDVISGFHQLKVGDIVQTYIAAIVDAGCIVKIFDPVRGLVPKKDIESDLTTNMERDYYVGQVIKCRVVSCDPDREKLILSFRLKPTAKSSTNGKTAATAEKLEPQIVEVKVVGKEDESLKVEILNVDGAKGKLVGDMNMMHLSDDPSDAQVKYNKIEIGHKLSGCALITATRPLKVSMKQSLVDFITSSEETLTVSDFVADRLLPGYVANVAEYGVFVRFVGGITALCPKSMLTDRYVKSTGGLYEVDQSVTACVKENNEQTNKLVVSLRPSDCHVETKEETESKEKIEEYMTSQEAKRAGLKILVGDVVVLKRKEGAEEEAAMMECSLVNDDHPNADKMTISLLKTATPPTTNADGNIEAVVFDVQPNSDDTCKVFVSSAPLVVAAYKSKKKMSKFAPSSIRCEGVVLSRNDVATCCYITEVVQQKSLLGKIVVFLHQTSNKATSDEKVSFFLLKTGPQNRYLLGRVSNEAATQRVVMKNATNGQQLTAGGRIHPREVEVGSQVTGKVKSVRHTHVILHMTSLPLTNKGKPVMGRIHFSQTDISEFNDGDFPLRKMKVGDEITCRVIGHRTIKSHTFLEVTRNDAVNVMLELSMLPADSTTTDEMSLRKRHPIGSVVKAVVRDSMKSNNKDPRDVARFAVEVSTNVEAFVSLLTANTKKVIKGDRSDVRAGMLMKCYVADHPGKNRLTLVREGSLVSDAGSSGYEIQTSCELNGKVCEIVNDGLLVKCPFGSKGKINITDLSDEFTDNPLEQYITKNSYIRCRVLDCSSRDRMILTMRCGGDNVRDPVVCDVTKLKSGQKIRGFVKTFSQLGIFVVLSREVTGRVTFKNASKYYINNENRQRAAEVFKPGKLLLCCVLSVKDGKVDLSLLEKDTGVEDNVPEEWGLPMRGEKRKKSTKSAEAKKRKRNEKESGESVESVLEELESVSAKKPSKIIEFSKRADTEEDKEVIGFNWNKEEEKMDVTDDEDNNDEDDEVTAKKRKLNKKKEAELQKESKEQDIRDREDRLAKESEDFEPKTVDDWKRKIVANPHDSELWIRFMSFHIHSTEIDLARVVAEEALKTIQFGMVEERLNVWIAMIRMEIMFGSDETVESMIERALKHNDQLKVYNHLITIYIDRNEHEKAEELHKKVVKKFRLNEQVWTAYIRYLTEQNRYDDAHDVLKRSLQSINQKSHIRFLSLFARLCLSSSSETMRGVNIFEKILNDFPKRGDVWSQYLQALESNDLIEEARKAFERVIETPMSSKKSKSFFKRYLAFEEKHGTQATLKQKSLEYIERFGKQEED